MPFSQGQRQQSAFHQFPPPVIAMTRFSIISQVYATFYRLTVEKEW
jgi:hypothetical protein